MCAANSITSGAYTHKGTDQGMGVSAFQDTSAVHEVCSIGTSAQCQTYLSPSWIPALFLQALHVYRARQCCSAKLHRLAEPGPLFGHGSTGLEARYAT